MDAKIIEKVKKLLRMADTTRGATQAEAEQAMSRAQEIIREHQLSLADVADVDGMVPPALMIGQTLIKTERDAKDIDNYIAQILLATVEIKIVWTTYYNEKQQACRGYALVGDELDREYARAMFDMLCIAMPTALLQYLQSNNVKLTASTKCSYYQGLAAGFIAACKAGGIAAHGRATEKARNAYALVVIDKKKEIASYYDKAFPNTTPTRARSYQPDARAMSAGHAKGQSMDIGGRKLNTSIGKLN